MPVAIDDLTDYAEYIARDSKDNARAWFESMAELLQTLDTMPYRYPAVQEWESLGREMRVINTKTHRVFFSIHEDTQVVEVLRVWHTARQPLDAKDFPKHGI